MNLRHYISHYIGYHVMFTLYMHEQSYNQCSYQGVQCTYYGKTKNTDSLSHQKLSGKGI